MVPQCRANVADRPAFRDVGFEALEPRISGGELPSLFDMAGQQIPVEHGHPEGGQFHAYVFPVMSHAPVAVVLTAIANLLPAVANWNAVVPVVPLMVPPTQ